MTPKAGDPETKGEAVADTIESRLRTGRPLGAYDWIARMEQQQGRPLAPQKRGPKPKRAN